MNVLQSTLAYTQRFVKNTLRRKYGKQILVSIVIVLLTLFTALSLTLSHRIRSSDNSTEIGQFGFDTLLPTGKSVNQVNDWQRVSPENTVPVYAYADMIGDIPISMSQQKIPEALASNPATKVAELAKGFGATNTIAAGDTTAYIGTSAKGPQSVIFIKNDVLILIKSEKQISGSAWATYIESLK